MRPVVTKTRGKRRVKEVKRIKFSMALRSILFLQRNVHRIPMRSLCDESFSRLNIYKDPAQAPKELVRYIVITCISLHLN